jgi:uncharacterized protein (DUF1800 family)
VTDMRVQRADLRLKRDLGSCRWVRMAASKSGRRTRARPGTPRRLRATAVSAGAVTLSWNAAKHGPKAAGYDVLRDGTRIATTRRHAYTDRHVRAGRLYEYRIRAYDEARRTGPSTKALAVKVPAHRAQRGTQPPATMNQAMVDRIFWRAGFGPSAADRARWVGQPVSSLVDHFLSTAQAYPPADTPPTVSGQPIDPVASNDDLVIEWLYRMVTAVNPLTERLTFFWHRHFAVARSSGIPPQWLLGYRNRLQRYGDLAAHPDASFRALALEMTTQDGAMSYFLTGDLNVAGQPNENYAREFMELFTLGVQDAQGNPNYSQQDVEELARAFTGWTLDQAPASPTYGQTRFNPGSFDARTKRILGKTGAFTAAESVDIVLSQRAHAPFLITKLWHEFILAPIPPVTLADLIATYTAGDQLLLAPLIRKILTHPLMFESLGEPNMIKPPVVYYVGLIKAMDAPLQDYWPAQTLDNSQQLPYDPPNVAGWEGGLSWLNTSTVAARFDAVISSQWLKYKTNYIDEGGPGETGRQAFDRAYAATVEPWLSPQTEQLLLTFANTTASSDVYGRRERQYALRAFMLAGPDAQVM